MKRFILSSAMLLACSAFYAQQVYTLDEPSERDKIVEGALKMGGKSPSGGSISVNNYYMSIDGVPSIPVMGEFHYSRYPVEQWEEEIMKIKAGGVNVIPSYIFWSLHEQKEGEFSWTGNRDLRHFIELCRKHDMYVIVRIGPFGHGEIRNGGIPDWIFAKPLEIRCNNSLYLSYVRKFYKQIARQLEGLYYKDGGPIIGCQIENELQHSAAPWGINYPSEPKDMTVATMDVATTKIGVSVQDKRNLHQKEGEEHMLTLKYMAEEEGIVTPLYTATGWGNAAVIGNEALPVTAAYTYPFWAEPKMSPFCLFKDIRRNPDYAPVRYDVNAFPSFCAEMGVGIQMIYSRRPIVSGKAAEALMVRTLGSGSNGIGYYMYHGGSTPLRSDSIGSYNDEPMGMPKISYDFQAPIGEFGLEHESYRYLRLLHTFLADFGSQLAPMQSVLPKDYDKIVPSDRETLRYAARMSDGSGFLFMVNFQDHDEQRHDQSSLQIKLNLLGESITIPSSGSFTLPKDENLILPFNFKLYDATLKYATAQLLMKIDDRGVDHYFFFAPDGADAEYLFSGIKGKNLIRPKIGVDGTFTVTTKAGKKIKITTLTRSQALNSCKVNGKILITDATVLPSTEGVSLLSLGRNSVDYMLYPSKYSFKMQRAEVKAVSPQFSWQMVGGRRMTIHFNDSIQTPQVNEYFLKVDYRADVAMAFINGILAQDEFYHGAPWMIGLKRYREKMSREDMVFYFRPLTSKAPYLKDLPKDKIPDLSKGSVLEVNDVAIIPQYKIDLGKI